jgi:hypothetical protein
MLVVFEAFAVRVDILLWSLTGAAQFSIIRGLPAAGCMCFLFFKAVFEYTSFDTMMSTRALGLWAQAL